MYRADAGPDHISVIMAVYNGAAFLHDSIGSVLSQTHRDWDLIVVDDGSTDESAEIVEAYTHLDPRIHLLRNRENIGLGESRNVGLRYAYSAPHAFVSFLDCDDWWFPRRLEDQVRFMRQRGVAFGYGSFQAWRPDLGKVSAPVWIPSRINYDQSLWFTYFAVPTVMLDTEQVGDVLFPKVRLIEDMRLWNRVLEKGVVAHGFNQSLALVRLTPGSLSRVKSRMARERLKVLREEGLSGTSLYAHMAFYAFRGLLKQRVEYRPTLPCPLELLELATLR